MDRDAREIDAEAGAKARLQTIGKRRASTEPG
jgi:hypothetical protein